MEPLLDRIARNTTTVVCPVIDVIDDTTLEYHYHDSSGVQVGGFDWNLQFNWHPVPDWEKKKHKDNSEPVWSPTMAGGLFSIDTKFFTKLGMYDPDFDIWGGENLELSFKTWMCGGTLEIIPCSVKYSKLLFSLNILTIRYKKILARRSHFPKTFSLQMAIWCECSASQFHPIG